MLALLALVAVLVVGAAVLVRVDRHAPAPTRVSARVKARPRLPLLGRNWLLAVPKGRLSPLSAPPALAVPGGGSCFVQGGSCSLTPCVIYAGGSQQPVAEVNGAVLKTVLTLPTPLRRQPGNTCPGGRGTPRILRVAAR